MSQSVIILATLKTPVAWYAAQAAMRTCRESCNAEILFIVNNTPGGSLLDRFIVDCASLGVHYHYEPGPFHMNRLFNVGTDLTAGEYIAYCNQDLIFYPGWFDNLCRAWQAEPKYWLLVPYNQGYRETITQIPKPKHRPGISMIHNHATGLLVLKRASQFRFDEQFCDWEQDADLHYHFTRHNLAVGCCLSSRVDHMEETVRGSINMSEAVGIENHGSKATELLKKKWNL